MFFSVDIKNSTAAKEHTIDNTFIWPHFYEAFYEAFPMALGDAFPDEALKPSLWKVNGDELLFSSNLSKDPSKVGEIVKNFLSAANKIRDAIPLMRNEIKNITPRKTTGNGGNEETKPPVDFDVNLKCTVWCAPVPHRNIILDIKDQPKDYVGPEIDLGFRLSAHSTPDHPAICPITALLLLLYNCTQYEVLFNGLHTLKGFTKPMPIHLLSKNGRKETLTGFQFERINCETLTAYIKTMCPDLIIPGVKGFDENPDLVQDNELEKNIQKVIRKSFALKPRG